MLSFTKLIAMMFQEELRREIKGTWKVEHKGLIATITTNVLIDVHMSSMDVVSFVGVPPLGEAKSQCKGSVTFWLNSLMEIEEFICIVMVNATFEVCQLITCVNDLK
jgi:hypothetical protein